MQQRVVWSSWAEWRGAYADLFALDDAARRRAGVQRVATWRSRGRVPHAVEATCSLAELALADVAGAASLTLRFSIRARTFSLVFSHNIDRLDKH